MKFRAFAVFILIVLFFFLSGCAREEEVPFPRQKASVKKTIVRPSPAESSAKESLNKSIGDQKDQKQNMAGRNETVAAEIKAEVEKNVPEEKNNQKKGVEGIYISEKGDTLSIIAGKEKVMGEPLKWPILYRLNIKGLKDLGTGADLPDRPLPEGTKLKSVTDEVLKNNLETIPENLWVINILSSTEKEKIIPVAVKLLREGYYVYISKATVRGKEWLRLRVGFFNSRNITDIKGKRIKSILNIPDIWAAKIDRDEFREYAGYQIDS